MNFTNLTNCLVIINDCRDTNAAGRQKIRATHLFDQIPTFIGVSNELEAAGNLIDTLDALDGTQGTILVNVAPRHGTAKKWENGIPFGYFYPVRESSTSNELDHKVHLSQTSSGPNDPLEFSNGVYHKNTLVVSTIGESILGLTRKFNLSQSINILDTAKATEKMVQDGFIPGDQKDQIVRSQFRSFDFLPRIAAYLIETKKELGEKADLASFPDTPGAVWLIDNFGNCKTTLLAEDISFSPGKLVLTKIGGLTCYPRLKDVPNGKPALIIGSSGLKEKRFLEIVVQGQNAAKHFDLTIGSQILEYSQNTLSNTAGHN